MPEGRLYMTDATAEAMGGREHVEAIYERVGDGGQIIIHGPADSREQIAFLFFQARLSSGADPFMIDPEQMDEFIDEAMSKTKPSFYSMDIDGDGTFDIASYRFIPERFEADTWWKTFPGDSPEQVRDFITGHEFGHRKMRAINSNDFWSVWQSETDADQDSFRGMGESATIEFQRSILAARAGNALHLLGERMALGFEDYSDNMHFKHASVLGTFLPGEFPYTVTEANLRASLNEFHELISAKIHDNYVEQNPNFEIDISGLSKVFIGVDDMRDLEEIEEEARTFTRFVGQQNPEIAAFYGEFRQNLNNLLEQQRAIERLTDNFTESAGSVVRTSEPEWIGDMELLLSTRSIPVMEQMASEYHQALSFMRDTHPEMFRDYIAQNHPDLITRQTGVLDPELFSAGQFDLEVFHGNNARLAQIVLQLRDEGAFDDNPIQRRLADYIEIDMQVRPRFYQTPEPPEQEAGITQEAEAATTNEIIVRPSL